MLNYIAQIKGDKVYKDSLLQIRYNNIRIDVGRELEFSLGTATASSCSLMLKSVTGRAVLLNKDKEAVKELVFNF